MGHARNANIRSVNLLVYKLTLTPLAVGLATAIGRRFGPALGGWVAGIPFTSAPIAIFVTLDHGVSFGTIAAAGILAATASQAAFALVYSVVATRARWPMALSAAALTFVGATAGLNVLQPSPLPALEIVVGAIALALSMVPRRRSDAAQAPVASPASAPVLLNMRIDILFRAVIATAIVVALTALSGTLGPTLAGLLSPLPVFGAVLIVFPHRLQGGDAAISACRGFLWGLFAAAAFGFLVAQMLPRFGLAPAMAAALAAAVALQGVTLLLVRGRAIRR
jgi:hypothetical protein